MSSYSIADQLKCKTHTNEYITNYCSRGTSKIIKKIVALNYVLLAYAIILSFTIALTQNPNMKISKILFLELMRI
jgi:hypothetical protein